MNKFTRHNGLAISDICLCSYPCQHWVEINNKGGLMNGRNIANIIHFTHPDYLHFVRYKRYGFLKPIIAPIHYLVRGQHQWYEGEEKNIKKNWRNLHVNEIHITQ